MKKKNTIIFAIVSFAIPLIYILINVHRTCGPVLPPDEFGYWKNAAGFIGLDWTEAFYRQPYYANGYSILLWPLMLLPTAPHTMYKCALIVNALLFGASALALYALVRELTGAEEDTDSRNLPAIVLAGVFYPAHFVYMNYTIAESAIYLLVPLTFLMLIRYEKKGRPHYAILTVISACVCTAVHFRTVCIPVAVVIAIIVKWRTDRKKITIKKAAAPLLIAFAVAAVAVTACTLLGIRTGFDYLNTSLDKIQKACTPAGILDTFMGIAGKIFYICVSTFGLFFFWLRRTLRRRSESITEDAFFLAFILGVAISSVFLVASKGVYFLVYGRYNEIFAPIMVSLGLYELGKGESKKNDMWIICTVATAILSAVLTIYSLTNEMNEYVRELVIGMSWFFGRTMPTVNMFILIPSIVCIISTLFFIRMDAISHKENRKLIAPSVTALVVFLFIGIRMSEICVYEYQDIGKSDAALFEEATKMYDDGHEVVFLRYPWSNYVGHLQFYMWDRKITFIEGLDPEAYETDKTAIVFTYPDYEDPGQLEARYDTTEKSAHLNMYYNKEY